MKLACFGRGERDGRLGAAVEEGPGAGRLVDLNAALALRLGRKGSAAPEREATSRLPPHPLDFLRLGSPALEAAREALAFVRERLAAGGAQELERDGVLLRQDDVPLRAPVPRPGKILGVARNYAAHAREQGQTVPPEEPVLFVKASSAVTGPRDPIVLPAASDQVDFEGELAVVVGRRSRRLDEAEALSAVAGYTAANDVSARDWQGVRGQHFIGKSCDTFAPLGPFLVTPDEIPDPQDLALRTIVSGELMQQARTKEMLFSVAHVVAFASRLVTLEPGDVILTGTPSGVGRARRPPRWLREGDVVEVQIEGIGALRNPVVREQV